MPGRCGFSLAADPHRPLFFGAGHYYGGTNDHHVGRLS
jgi:hypothetical protein